MLLTEWRCREVRMRENSWDGGGVKVESRRWVVRVMELREKWRRVPEAE